MRRDLQGTQWFLIASEKWFCWPTEEKYIANIEGIFSKEEQ